MLFKFENIYIHTYKISHYKQPFIQDYDLAAHTTHVMCVSFIHKWQDLQFNVDFEPQIFDKLFTAGLFDLKSSVISEKKFSFIFHFVCNV